MKRKLSLFLTIVMMLSLITGGTFFSVQANTQESMPKTFSNTEFVHLTDVPNGYIGVYSKTDLDTIKNELSGNYILMNDIEFSDEDFSENGQFYNSGNGWGSIGNSETPFIGVFDGNGYCINGLEMSSSVTDFPYIGLFGYNKGLIKNIITVSGQIDITHVSNTVYVGMVAGYSEGTIENCKSVGTISVESTILRATYETPYSYVGGITGYSAGTLSLCENTCNIQSSPSVIGYAEAVAYLGGVAGAANTSTVSNCINSGAITLSPTLDANTGITVYAGGILGQSNGNTSDCDNNGSVVIEEFKSSSTSSVSIDASFYVAGIIGYSTGTIAGSNNAGTIRARGVYAYSGGVAGYDAGTLSQCSNIGNILAITTSTGGATYSYGYSGGVAGYSKGTISESYNTGFVEVIEAGASEAAYSGGIVAYKEGGTITNCYNAGFVPDKSYYGDTGGIAGYSTGSISLCYNIGRVPKGYPSGGGAIVGNTSEITPNCFFLDDNKVGVAEGKDTTISCSKEELLLAETYIGFDFTSVWEIGVYDTYPCATLKNVEHKNSMIGKDLFAGGTGTAYDPFLIENAEQLNNIRVIPSAYYELISDIAFKNSDYAKGGAFYNNGQGWTPILYFVGSFDGCGHVISNLQINYAPTSYVQSSEKYASFYKDYFGLFGFNCGGTIRRVGVTGDIYVKQFDRPSFIDHAYVGGIAGASNGTISECYFIGSVYGTAEDSPKVGGICGWSWDPEGTLENCFSKVTLSDPTGTAVGGITGNGSYSNCYSTGYVVKTNATTNFAFVRGSGNDIDCTESEMRMQSTYTDFDFNSVWTLEYSDCYAYPKLISVPFTLDHSYGAWKQTKALTCTEDGEEQRVCGNDPSHVETRTVSALGHDFIHHEGKAATCTEKGWNEYDTCSRCDYTTYKEIVAKGHIKDNAVEENRIEATCTGDGHYDSVVYCSICNKELSRTQETLQKLGHNLVHHEGKSATCTEIGWNEYDTCSRCDYTTYSEIVAKGHTDVVDKAVAPTCTETGLTEGKHCSVCGEVLVAQNVVAALGHNKGNAVEENRIEATCTADGHYDSVVYCTVCNEELSRTEVKLSALGHDFIHHEGKAATCTEKGWNEYDTCSRCDYTTYKEIVAKGHIKDNAVEENRIEATCTGDGHYDSVVYCSICNEELSRTQETLQKLGHNLVHHEGKSATCTEIGWNEYDTCSRCDYTTYSEIVAKGHTDVVDKAVAPTCTETGLTEGKHCSVCGEVLATQSVVPALGHDMGEWQQTKVPDCVEVGEECRDCSRCDYFETRELVALGHSETDWIVDKEATCTEAGSKHRECSVCHEHLATETITAHGHEFGEWITATEPTTKSEGKMIRTCKLCGEQEEKTIDKLSKYGCFGSVSTVSGVVAIVSILAATVFVVKKKHK